MIVGLVRHGETDANRREIVQGRADTYSLTEKGRRQILELGIRIRELGLPFKMIYSSPSRRARETAEILSSLLGLDVKYDDDLMEMDFGDLEGLPYAEVYKRDDFEIMSKHFSRYRAPKGESSVEVQERMKRFLHRLDLDVLIVSHAVAIATLLCWVKGISLDHVWEESVGNGRLYLLEKRGTTFTLIEDPGSYTEMGGSR